MSNAQIVALFFVQISLAIVIISVLLKNKRIAKVKKFLISSSSVYFSGTILIMLISIFKAPIPIVFILISDLLITFVFVMSAFTIIKISNQILEIRKENDEKTNKDNT